MYQGGVSKRSRAACVVTSKSGAAGITLAGTIATDQVFSNRCIAPPK